MPPGNTSLYLDVFTKEGRKYEYLKLYLVPEHTRADKKKNRQTMQLAEAIRAKDKPLARNSKLSYFNKLRACLNHAFDERIIAHNPIRGIEDF